MQTFNAENVVKNDPSLNIDSLKTIAMKAAMQEVKSDLVEEIKEKYKEEARKMLM